MFYLLIGIVLLVVGLISAIGYATNNEALFWKREYMRKFWGEKLGTAIHFGSYVIIAIGYGLYLIYTHWPF